MNDTADKSKYPDLYLTLNPAHETLHITVSYTHLTLPTTPYV